MTMLNESEKNSKLKMMTTAEILLSFLKSQNDHNFDKLAHKNKLSVVLMNILNNKKQQRLCKRKVNECNIAFKETNNNKSLGSDD